MIALCGCKVPELAVWDGTLPLPSSVKGNYCNIAEIIATPGGQPVNVLRAPDHGTRIVDRLSPGTRVYTCNEARRDSGRWYGIVFAGPDRPCAGAVELGLDILLSRNCRSGWVPLAMVEVISG